MRVYPKMAFPNRRLVSHNTKNENLCDRLDSNRRPMSRPPGKEWDHPFPPAPCRASILQIVRSTRMLSPSAETCSMLLCTSFGDALA